MDLSSVNPNAYSDQEQFPIGDGRFLKIPTVAKSQSRTAASQTPARHRDLRRRHPQRARAEAMAIAVGRSSTPASSRNDIERKRFSVHRTPSGYTLVSLEARV